MSLQAALGVSQTISAAVVDTLEQGFHEEHLELQQSELSQARTWFDAADEGERSMVPWVE